MIIQDITNRLQNIWTVLQMHVNNFMDSDINKRMKDVPSGIKQVIIITVI